MSGQCQYGLNGGGGCTSFCGSYTCTSQYAVQPDYLNLNNFISYPYNDGYASIAF